MSAYCDNVYKGLRCVLLKSHSGDHEAEFPRYHCHVDRAGRVTPNVEQPYRWGAGKGKSLRAIRRKRAK